MDYAAYACHTHKRIEYHKRGTPQRAHTRMSKRTRRVISILYPRLSSSWTRTGSPSRHPRCFPSPDGLIHNLCTTAARPPPLASSSLPAARRRVSQVCTCADEPNLTVFPRGGSSHSHAKSET